MVIVEPEPSALDSRVLTLYFTKDLQLGNLPVVVFHGPSTTTNSTLNTSRIQAHIFSVAGYQSFPRLTISPTSPLYTAVHQLPAEDQGDEISRGLAISICKYFNEIPKAVKECLQNTLLDSKAVDTAQTLFDAAHAARLASQMEVVENSAQIITHLMTALTTKSLSWTDIDLILPPNSISKIRPSGIPADVEDDIIYHDDKASLDYGRFSELVELFGSSSFLPTSRLRRAPSKPTGGSKAKVLSDEQISALRLDLREILETERNYVSKIHELANSVATQWVDYATETSAESKKAVEQLFPPSLHQILEVNTQFLDELEKLLENQAAVADDRDLTRTNSVAKLLLDSLPLFHQPYVDYIQASNGFFSILNDVSRDSTSHLVQQLHQTGEQRLRSWLIEPVQRLPRYSLFIETIVKKLPLDHPAIPKLLKAKDLIGEILDAQEAGVDNNARTLKRLRSLILNWPASLDPGRLITAADVIELKAPYTHNPRNRDEPQGMLLLFPDYVLVLRKTSSSSLSARGLIAELDRSVGNSTLNPQQPTLSLAYSFKLRETRFTEASDGHLICLASVKKVVSETHVKHSTNNLFATTQVYALLGAYEGKAARWNEEIARARIEYRFPEKLREDDRWCLRTIGLDKNGLGLISAVFEADIDLHSEEKRRLHGRIRVFIQDQGETCNQTDNLEDIEVTASITLVGSSKYRLEVKGFNGNTSSDNVHAEDLLGVFLRRMSNIQRTHHLPTTAIMAQIYVSANRKIVETIRPNLTVQPDVRNSTFRPISPVKVLSSFLGGIRDQATPKKAPTLERSNSKQSVRSLKDMKPGFSLGFGSAFEPAKTMPIAKTTDDVVEGAFVQLEKSFNTYIMALNSRCGNVVGKVIRNRANADELMVNELYNVLLEDPTQYQATAEVPVDVLFAAFEIFLNRAWKDKMGPLLPSSILSSLERIIYEQTTSQLGVNFKSLLQEMTPQNQRAFTALVKLLYDLLDASGNDGDRGAITAAFAEAMFHVAEYQKYISLLDRMVDNIDVLLDDVIIPEEKQLSQLNSMGRRIKATTPGSISSTTSSFKKRFGFGTLSRENSKNESESRVGQILRNLSKKAVGESTSQPSSLSKSFLTRSKSIDNENRRPFFSRPGSAAGKEPSSPDPRPASSHRETPDLIAPMANLGLTRGQAARKKRRSSLSDITSIQNSSSPAFLGDLRPRVLDTLADSIAPFKQARKLPRTPSPVKVQNNITVVQSDSASKIPSPTVNRKLASPSPTRKENVPPISPLDRNSPQPRIVNTSNSFGSPTKRGLHSTQIPSLKPSNSSPSTRGPQRNILSPSNNGSPKRKVSGSPQRITSGSPQRRVLSGSPQRRSSATTQRLRMQSPQKLRERLEREKKAIEEAGPSLQSELAKISEELGSNSTSSRDLKSRVDALESKLTKTLADLADCNASIRADVETSLVVSEKKAKSLDEVYRESNTENELLYDKFNGELVRVLEAVKSGAGLQELKGKLKEAQDESIRLRKENQRLKRENLGLKSQLR